MNWKRSNFSLVSMDGTLVAAGGYNGRAVTDVVEVFHPERNQWQEVSSLPSPKSAFAMVVVRRGDHHHPVCSGSVTVRINNQLN